MGSSGVSRLNFRVTLWCLYYEFIHHSILLTQRPVRLRMHSICCDAQPTHHHDNQKLVSAIRTDTMAMILWECFFLPFNFPFLNYKSLGSYSLASFQLLLFRPTIIVSSVCHLLKFLAPFQHHSQILWHPDNYEALGHFVYKSS